MLDFMKVKLALFDFDDTLCIHTVRPQVRDEVAYDVDIMCGKDPWPDGIVPQSMGGFVRMLDARSIPMGLISATNGFGRMKAKQEWVESHYGVHMDNYCVGTADRKLEMLAALQRRYAPIGRGELLLVDDLYSTLDEAAKEGYMACSPMEIAWYMELMWKEQARQ